MATPYEDKSIEGLRVFRWNMGGADSGEPVLSGAFNDKSYCMEGTWGSATVVLEGNFDNDKQGEWVTLKESDNTTAISNTELSVGVVLENPIWIRPRSTGGTDTSVIVTITAK